MAGTGVLKELESLLDQFFSGTSSNEQKQEINKLLEQFAQQQGVWRYCIHFMQYSTNQHVLMYSLNLIENLVTKMWVSLTSAEKAELRHFIMQQLVTCHSSLPVFLRNKLVKVVVLTGRADWPNDYPEFFSHILQLVRSRDTTTLGLYVLLTASEELAAPRSDFLTTQRREELGTLMHQQAPTILSVLMHILESVAEKQCHSVTPTPPPSPNVSPIKTSLTKGLTTLTPPRPHSSTPSPFGTPTLQPAASPLHPAHQLTFALKGQPLSGGNVPYAPLDSATEDVCVHALKCLAHLFGWIPLSSLITPNILETVFHFAGLGCDSVADATENSGNLGSLAMDCINELLVKNCVPREFEAFLMKLFEKSFSLLQRLTGESQRGISCNFSQLDDRFLAKCSDFFYWFVSSHLKRVEFNPSFPVLEFLSLFYQYTFKQPEVDSFCVCLETWGVFLDHLIMMSSDTYGMHSPPTNNHYERYKGILVTMMESILQKVQLHYNIDQLREVDDDAIDDDNETEWQSFLRQSLEFIAKVAELFPPEAFHLLLPPLESYSTVYLSLSQLVVTQPTGSRALMISEGPECEKLHAVLKDLTSVLQALGRLAEHFTGDYFIPRLSDSQLLVNKFCLIAKYSVDTMLFNISTPVPEILDHDFIELHAQVLGTLQAFTHWLSQLYLETIRNQEQPQLQESLVFFVTSIVSSCIPLITQHVPEKVVLSACQLFLSLASSVRPKFLLSLPEVQTLTSKACGNELTALPQRAYTMVHRALCHMTVLPWPDTPDILQEWDARSAELAKLVRGTAGIFARLKQTQGWEHNLQLQQQVKVEVKRTIVLLDDLAASIAHEPSKSKSTFFKSISHCVDFAISLFPVYLNQADVLDTLMGFFLTIFDSLRSQLGPFLTQRTTQTFMGLLTREHIEGALEQEGSHGSKVVEKFLKILQLLVMDPNNPETDSLPSIISFAMKQIYPAIVQKHAPDVKSVLYELLFQLLVTNWRYFFPTNVLSHMDKQDTHDPMEHEEEFFSIMEGFGNSFLQSDIAIFKQNLSALEALNSKHKLYSKSQFQSCMLYPLMQILFQALVQKSHDLLQDEITSCIYCMASVNFHTYHQQFLPKFLTSIETLTHEQQNTLIKNYKKVEDLPSFVQTLRQLTNDLRYFLIVNRSVPVGSVKLT